MNIYNGVSFLGLWVLVGVAWLFSENRRNFNWRVVIFGVLLQILIAFFVFVVPAGAKVFLALNDAVIHVMDSASAGARFMFGRLAISPGQTSETGEPSLGFILAFQAFPTIIFFSSLMSVLYFFRILPRIVQAFAFIFTKFMKVSGAESLVTASNIFVGVESALTIKPYLATMTRSELCVVLTAGMATVASNILALYIFSLKAYFPAIAGHLISASLLSAPAALIMAKIMVPESGTPETLGVHIKPPASEDKSVFEAVIHGANAGLKMIAGISALLIAVLGLLALCDRGFVFLGEQIHALSGVAINLSLKNICGYVFYPFTLIMGVPLQDAWTVARIVGERLVVTEVVSYQDLAAALARGEIHDPRSAVIATYALCGFAHLASMAIFVGGAAALAPARTQDLTRVAFKALVAATLACMMTACVAGTFFTGQSVLFGK
jgi:concentrative nucleoside transporter, CNT family